MPESMMATPTPAPVGESGTEAEGRPKEAVGRVASGSPRPRPANEAAVTTASDEMETTSGLAASVASEPADTSATTASMPGCSVLTGWPPAAT